MYRFFLHATRTVAIGAMVLLFGASTVLGEFAGPGLVEDINGGLSGQQDIFADDDTESGTSFLTADRGDGTPTTGVLAFGSPPGEPGPAPPFTVDDNVQVDGNEIVLIMQNDGPGNNNGGGIIISVSNGDNGDTWDNYCAREFCNLPGGAPSNRMSTPSNNQAADSVFSSIGNSSGKLENGNVLRFSFWMRLDPSNLGDGWDGPDPQIEPTVKFEFYRDALATGAGAGSDDNGGDSSVEWQPTFGSRIFDTFLNRQSIPDLDPNNETPLIGEERGVLIDLDADLSRDEWRQVVHTYTVDDGQGLYSNPDPNLGVGWDICNGEFDFCTDNNDAKGGAPGDFVIDDVTMVEEIRAVMFLGDFAATALSDNGLWLDNALVEVFADSSAELASDVTVSNPNPDGIPGDFDGDGDVDGDDFLLWQLGGSPIPLSQSDLGDWEANYGTVAPLSAISTAVPEPSSVLLVLIGVLCLKGTSRHSRLRN